MRGGSRVCFATDRRRLPSSIQGGERDETRRFSNDPRAPRDACMFDDTLGNRRESYRRWQRHVRRSAYGGRRLRSPQCCLRRPVRRPATRIRALRSVRAPVCGLRGVCRRSVCAWSDVPDHVHLQRPVPRVHARRRPHQLVLSTCGARRKAILPKQPHRRLPCASCARTMTHA